MRGVKEEHGEQRPKEGSGVVTYTLKAKGAAAVLLID